MRFDRTAPSGGLEIYSTVRNGKAALEYKVFLQQTGSEEYLEKPDGASLVCPRGGYLDIRMWDRDGQLVFCCCHPLCEEEAAKGLLLHPRLWQGVEEPYLYRIRVSLMEREDVCMDVLEDTFALRTFRHIPEKGWFLNDQPFQIRAVEYELPKEASVIRGDLELVRNMGANTLCLIDGKFDREFCRLCDEAGLLLWWRDRETAADIPRFYGTADSLLTLQGRTLSDRYYFYRAYWSREPFVYISITSLSFQKNGNAQVTVYSNQKKIALYVNGVLFEFRMGGPDFLFEEIPVKSLPLLLTAEAGSCSMSVTAYPFTKYS